MTVVPQKSCTTAPRHHHFCIFYFKYTYLVFTLFMDMQVGPKPTNYLLARPFDTAFSNEPPTLHLSLVLWEDFSFRL